MLKLELETIQQEKSWSERESCRLRAELETLDEELARAADAYREFRADFMMYYQGRLVFVGNAFADTTTLRLQEESLRGRAERIAMERQSVLKALAEIRQTAKN